MYRPFWPIPSSEGLEVILPEMSPRPWSVSEVAGMAEGGSVVVGVFEKGLGVVGANCEETGVSLQV